MKLFLVLSSGLSGAISLAIVFVPDANWLTNPTNECSSVHVVGLGNYVMAVVMRGLPDILLVSTEILQT